MLLETVVITKDEPIYHYLSSNGVEIREGLKNIPILNDYDKSVNHGLDA